jgi:hypothetical protein
LVHISLGIVIDDRCCLVLERHRNLGNAGNGLQASFDDRWAAQSMLFTANVIVLSAAITAGEAMIPTAKAAWARSLFMVNSPVTS